MKKVRRCRSRHWLPDTVRAGGMQGEGTQAWGKVVGKRDDSPAVDIGLQRGVFEVRDHARKGSWHRSGPVGAIVPRLLVGRKPISPIWQMAR
jgi:hypothetical protein